MKNRVFYVICGGPSLRGYNFNQLANKDVIAVNKAYLDCAFAPYIYFTDKRFFDWFPRVAQSRGSVYTAGKIDVPNITKYRLTGHAGIDTRPGCIKGGNNSGYAAINLAIHLGATIIIVLGLDMYFEKDGNKIKHTHYHGGYPVANTEKSLNKMRPYFETMVEPLKELGITVYNASPLSTVTCFTKIKLETAHLYPNIELIND